MTGVTSSSEEQQTYCRLFDPPESLSASPAATDEFGLRRAFANLAEGLRDRGVNIEVRVCSQRTLTRLCIGDKLPLARGGAPLTTAI